MHATSLDRDVDVSEYWISEKLDGVRGHWNGSQLLTRNGNIINAPEWFTDGWPEQAMDGELWIARGRFDEVSGIVRTLVPDDSAWREVKFMLFDLPGDPGVFDVRVERMRERVLSLDIPWLRAIEQVRLADADALDEHFRAVVAGGGEGLMLHHSEGRYVAGRSATLFKYKPFDDAEAQVIAYTPGTGKYTGMLGALIVETPAGRRFRIGTGFSDAQRADPPPVGSWVTYRYNGLTASGLPRFARFLRIRVDMPPPDRQQVLHRQQVP
ncbi:MAG: DNA ligase [Proteobacteria bacterium]|nr:DNA ligase [Pseudomonadota bacterium]